MVEKYRSIERSESIDLSTMSVLVGPNNEGKSNILRGMVVGLQALSQATRTGPTPRLRSGTMRQRLDRFEQYDWQRDFPLRLQKETPGAFSVFEFDFEFNEAELHAFKGELGHNLNGELKVRILLGDEGQARYRIVKRGRGSPTLNANVSKIAAFVSRRIRVEYIPVSRTSIESRSLIRNEAQMAMRALLHRHEYLDAVEVLNRLVSESLKPLEEQLLAGIREFLPEVHSVAIRGGVSDPALLFGDPDIDIDDGQLTSLASKGDGIQSLIAISLIARLAARTPDATYILAVEEPEAHLHPGAVHKLRAVLEALAQENQVILTTHSPILVSRNAPRANILVTNNQATSAVSLETVRKSLGIQLPDNMISANLILLVEGECDRRVLDHILSAEPRLAAAIKHGRLVIKSVGGAQNMPYNYRLHRDSVCLVHVLLDNDKEGKAARGKLDQTEGFQPSEVTMISVVGMQESEMEDLFDEAAFADVLSVEFNVSLRSSESHASKRFSLRMKDYFTASGQGWSPSLESNLKNKVAELICAGRGGEVLADRQGVLEALVAALIRKMNA